MKRKSRRSVGHRLITVAFVVLAGLAALLAGAWWWANQPLLARTAAAQTAAVDLHIPVGTSASQVAAKIAQAAGRQAPTTTAIQAWISLSGQSGVLKAGSYDIHPDDSLRSLLEKLRLGKQALYSVVFVEGWTWRQVRAALARAAHLRPDTALWTDAQIMKQLKRDGVHPEGTIFPDTYRYAKNASDLSVLRAAMRAMDRELAKAWQERDPQVPLQSPEELLIMASIVEKETAAPPDRGQISGVFANRLRINMRLQTDPAVIYGLGEAFDGNLRKRDLQTDTPYNTYTRAGLPPTPIAMPGRASLQAAARPEPTKALYFVARGDGSSQFSETLQAHNRAVATYVLGRQ